MNASMTKTRDNEIQDRVEQSLEWAPEVESAKIGVSVHDGVVTLYGEVPSYWQKIMADKIALKTRGVSAIADEIVVHRLTDPRSDSDIALAASNLIMWNDDVPEESVKIKVQDHVLTLTGEVSWNFEREAAYRSVKHLEGLRDIRNRITLKPRPHANAADTEVLIRRAIMRHASLDASRVHASVDGTRVILTGTVSSHAEKVAAAAAAWSSPHVDHVENKITVDG